MYEGRTAAQPGIVFGRAQLKPSSLTFADTGAIRSRKYGNRRRSWGRCHTTKEGRSGRDALQCCRRSLPQLRRGKDSILHWCEPWFCWWCIWFVFVVGHLLVTGTDVYTGYVAMGPYRGGMSEPVVLMHGVYLYHSCRLGAIPPSSLRRLQRPQAPTGDRT